MVVIPASEQPGKSQAKPVEHLPDPDQAWEDYASLSTQGYTLPEDAVLPDGSMGILTIPKLDLSAPVYETGAGGEIESMTKGVAHFAITSAWEGNIGLCSHNVAPPGRWLTSGTSTSWRRVILSSIRPLWANGSTRSSR